MLLGCGLVGLAKIPDNHRIENNIDNVRETLNYKFVFVVYIFVTDIRLLHNVIWQNQFFFVFFFFFWPSDIKHPLLFSDLVKQWM